MMSKLAESTVRIHAGAVALIVIGVLACVLSWEELTADGGLLADTLRSVAFVIGGTAALLIGWWRSTTASRQEATARMALTNDRYQRGVELLGHGDMSVRMGGLYSLVYLTADDASYKNVVLAVVGDFSRNAGERASEKDVLLAKELMANVLDKPADQDSSA